MSLFNQYKSILETFNSKNVDYMVIGGIAVNYHGYQRNTLDMDIWVDTCHDNISRIYDSLVSLGYEEVKCKEAVAYLKDNHIIKIPLENTKMELLDSFMVKIDFQESYKNHKYAEIEGVRIKMIGFNELLKCKEKSNRIKDLLDVKTLKELRTLQAKKEQQVNEIISPKKNKGKSKGFSL